MSRPRDEGSALVMVLGSMTVLTMFVSVALGYAINTANSARQATDWNQAFSAAEAGVDDFLARLNRDDAYWRTTDCTNTAMRRPVTGTAGPCGWGPDTEEGWLTVPGATRAEFHYELDVSSTPVDGTIDLVSTGRSGDMTRTIEVTLRRGGFGEFLYFTVYETKDPADYARPTEAVDRCAHYFWEPRTAVSKPRDTSYCTDINFVGGDRINGPFHTNDAILVRDRPWFQGTVTTSMPSCRPVAGTAPAVTECYRKGNTAANPRLDKGIAYRSEVEIPESIGDLRQYVDGSHPDPGCLYTGPTRIVFNAATGTAPPTMTVWSNWSKTTLNPGCGNPAAPWPQTVPVPRNNLVMVQDVPDEQPQPLSGPCAGGAIGDGFPLADDYSQSLREADCRYGTVYVEGTLAGRVTISADNNVVITGDLVYQGGENGTDALGLIAENSVQIYHPVGRTCTARDRRDRCTSWSSYRSIHGPDGTMLVDPDVHASVLTLQHSFEVQAHEVGAGLGSIRLFGSLAQKYRGLVGTTSGSGYLKNYNYDSRLRYAPPPYFLDPVRSAWGLKTFGEVVPRLRD